MRNKVLYRVSVCLNTYPSLTQHLPFFEGVSFQLSVRRNTNGGYAPLSAHSPVPHVAQHHSLWENVFRKKGKCWVSVVVSVVVSVALFFFKHLPYVTHDHSASYFKMG